jgi:hypothetical protein
MAAKKTPAKKITKHLPPKQTQSVKGGKVSMQDFHF